MALSLPETLWSAFSSMGRPWQSQPGLYSTRYLGVTLLNLVKVPGEELVAIDNILEHLLLTGEECATHLVFKVAHVQIAIGVRGPVVRDPQLSVLSAPFA